MNRTFTAGCFLGIWMLFLCTSLIAHDEPPKTRDEQQQKERIRATFAQHKVRIQHAWVMLPDKPDRPADSLLWQSNHFDQRGNPIEQVVIDSSGATRTINTFGEKNIWLEELTYFGDSLDDRTVFVYNPDGLIHQVLSFDVHGGMTGILDYTYHDSTNEIVVVKHDAAGALLYTIVYAYSPHEKYLENISAVQTKGDGSVMIRVENRFESGRRVGKTLYGPDGTLNRTFSYRYTDSGDYAEIITLNAEGTVLSIQNYRYSADGQLLELFTSDQSGEVTRRIHYHYEYYKDPLNNG
ncbi:MAG: hypothetical protein IPH75_10135 [bacterium]|nr:hypothetical protein [bacterium]